MTFRTLIRLSVAHPPNAARQVKFAVPGTMKLNMHWQRHLSSDPGVCGGELCARGTRIPVTLILDNLAEGAARDEILQSYPSLTADHISAALAYAAELAHDENMIPLITR